MLESCERKIINNHHHSFLRLPNRCIATMVDDGSEPINETIHFSGISYSFETISCLTIQSVVNFVEPTALVARVSCGDNESESSNWIF